MGIREDRLKIENYNLKEANKVLEEQAKQAQDKLDGEVSANAERFVEFNKKIADLDKIIESYSKENDTLFGEIKSYEERAVDWVNSFTPMDLIKLGIRRLFKRKIK